MSGEKIINRVVTSMIKMGFPKLRKAWKSWEIREIEWASEMFVGRNLLFITWLST